MHAAVPAPPRQRLEIVDLARGIALLAMFVFHFAYDLSYFGLIETDIPADPPWRWFARGIAGSFLVIVGFSLVLATRNGLDRKAYLRRLAMVAGAAALVTAGTFFAMRDYFIFFGILHQVALASVLALPFLRLPVLAVALCVPIVLAMPHLVAHSALDHPALLWLGLSSHVPDTADYVPVFPWFAWVLTGIVLARLALPMIERTRIGAWRAKARPARLVVWGGRHSLLVYLVHQPVFIGALMLATQGPLLRAPEEKPFLLSCQRSCATGTLGVDACSALCTCTVEGIKREGFWPQVAANTVSPQQSARISALAQACVRRP